MSLSGNASVATLLNADWLSSRVCCRKVEIFQLEQHLTRRKIRVVVDSEDSDWLSWLYPSPYTAAHRFGIVIMVLDGVLMHFDANDKGGKY